MSNRFARRLPRAALAALLLAAALLAPTAHAQASAPADAADAPLDRAGERLFRAYTRVFCQQFFAYEDRFILLPNYYREREASTGKTYDQAVEELTVIRTEHVGGNIVRHIQVPPPRGEAIAAALVLPDIDVGHYGHIDAVTIVRVVRDNEMIVKDLRLIDPAAAGGDNNARRQALVERQKAYVDQTYRLHGFPTQGLSAGQLYRGPRNEGLHIAVAGADQHHNFVLINYDRLRRIRTSEFEDALAYVDLSPAAFNELARNNREQHGAQGDKRTLIDIYKRYYTAFRVPRPEQLAQAPPQRPVTPPPATNPGRVSPGDTPATRPDPGTPGTPANPGNPDPGPATDPGNPPDLFPDVDEDQDVPDAPPPPPRRDRDRDDPDDDWTPPPAPEDPTFFGIPLD